MNKMQTITESLELAGGTTLWVQAYDSILAQGDKAIFSLSFDSQTQQIAVQVRADEVPKIIATLLKVQEKVAE